MSELLRTTGTGSRPFFQAALASGLALALSLAAASAIDFNPDIDTDGDGLADGWEIAYGLDPLCGGSAKLNVWYRMDETNGWSLADNTGHGLIAMIVGTTPIRFGPGRIGGALEFNGTDTGAVVADSPSLAPRNELTITAWVYPHTIGGGRAIVEKPGAYMLSLESGRPGLYCYDVTDLGYCAAAAPIPTNEWTHVAATYDGRIVKVFVNAVEAARMPATGLIGVSDQPLGIGFNPATGDRYFDGLLDDVRIYRRALTPLAIRGLFELGADPDADDLSSFDEFAAGVNPRNPDTDADFMRDGWELRHGLNPLADDRAGDPDGDGLMNIAEQFIGTDPRNRDTDGDGVPDPLEEVAQNGGAALTGVVTDPTGQTGLIWVIAGTNTGDWSTTYATALTGPGAYAISGVPLFSNWWVRAWRDGNGNQRLDGWEASGSCAANPIYLAGTAAVADITLQEIRPTDLWVGNDSAQVAMVHPVVTNAAVRFSAAHHHPTGQPAIGYRLEIARDPAFSSVVWATAGPETATRQWSRIWGSVSEEHARGLCTDAASNLLVAGYSYGSLPGQPTTGAGDFVLTKYSASGTEQWCRLWGSGAGDWAMAVAADADGNVYVAGHTYGSLPGQTMLGGADMALTKFAADGTRLWVRQWGSGDDDLAFGVAVDGAGRVYVAGYSWSAVDGQTNAGGADCVLTKFDTDGTRLWTRQWGSGQDDYARGVAIDSAGNVYVAGTTHGAFDGQTNAGIADLVLSKFSADGTRQWTRLWGSSHYDDAFGVGVDAAGNVYVTGAAYGAIDGQANAGQWDAVLTRFLPDGTRQWTRLWGSSADDYGYGIAVDAAGGIYVSGQSWGAVDSQSNHGAGDALLTKFSPDGNRQWTRLWGSANDETGYAVAVGGDGRIAVAGETLGAFDGQLNTGSTDWFVSQFSTQQGPAMFAAPVADGGRSPDIVYAGPALVVGATNYWRIGFYDGQTNASPWSATNDDWFVVVVDPGTDADGDGLTDYVERNIYGTNPASPDSDADNLPDGWETRYGLNPLVNDAAGDPDGDGANNYTEYLQGRNPRTGVVPDPGGIVSLQVFTSLE